MRTPLLVLALLQCACFSQDFVVVDQRGVGSANFWATVVNGQGQPLTFLSHYPLNPSGRTQLNVSTSVPVVETKDLEVTAWVDATGINECLDDCQPAAGDPVVKLSGRNWPFVYEIVFPAAP